MNLASLPAHHASVSRARGSNLALSLFLAATLTPLAAEAATKQQADSEPHVSGMVSARTRRIDKKTDDFCGAHEKEIGDIVSTRKALDKLAEIGPEKLNELDTLDAQTRDQISDLLKKAPPGSLPTAEELKKAKNDEKTRAANLKKAQDAFHLITEAENKRTSDLVKEAAGKLKDVPGTDHFNAESMVAACEERAGTPKAAEEMVSGALPLGSAAWQTAVIQGLSGFLSKRAEQEVVLWVVDELQKDICAVKRDEKKKPISPSPRDFFPRSCRLSAPDPELDAKPASPIIPGTVLAAAIRADLEELPARVVSWQTGIDKDVLLVLQGLLIEMRAGKPPLALLSGLKDSETLIDKCKKDVKPGSVAEERTKYLACGLVDIGVATFLAKDAAIGDKDSTELEENLEKFANLFIDELKDECKKHENACKDLAPTNESAQKFLLSIHALSKKLATAPKSDGAATLDYAGQIAVLLVGVMDTGVDLHKSEAQVRATWKTLRHVPLAISAALRAQYSESVAELIVVLADLGATLPPPLDKHVNLFVNLANAKTSDEVQAALEAAAAPVGSWRDKRNGPNVSLTGFVGLTGNWEQPFDTGDGKRKGNVAGGLFGAVGIDWIWTKNEYPFGLFFSLIDVGQLLSMPIAPDFGAESKDATGTTLAQKPEAGGDFQFAQIFSPGAYVRVGMGNSPFVIGAGVSAAPMLRNYRTLEVSSGAERSSEFFSMWRVGAFVAVDVTILPLGRSRD